MATIAMDKMTAFLAQFAISGDQNSEILCYYCPVKRPNKRFIICILLFLSILMPLKSVAAITPEENSEILSIASIIENDARNTTYHDVEEFGKNALKLSGPEKFVRLQYTSESFLEKFDIPKFEYWNKILADTASKEHSRRYQKIAEIDHKTLDFFMGDASAKRYLSEISENEKDWYVKSYALLQMANTSNPASRSTNSLTYINKAENLIQGFGLEKEYITYQVKEAKAFRLITVYDMYSSAKIMHEAAVIYHKLKLPRPNSQELFNLASIAIRLGDEDLAKSLISKTQSLKKFGNETDLSQDRALICAAEKQAFGTSQEVLKCLEAVTINPAQAGVMDSIVLFNRAISNARIGHLEKAESDFSLLKTMETQRALPPSVVPRMELLEAEMKFARGNARDGVIQLRDYIRNTAIADAQMYDTSRREITQEYNRNLELRAQLLNMQKIIIALAFLALAGGALMLGLQIRLANRYWRQRQRAVAATAAKTEFLSNMSHEIRTPLTAVIGFAELLGKRSDLPADVQSQITKIIDGGSALLLIVNDVLDFSKIESGQLELESHPYSPLDIASRTLGLVEGLAVGKGLRLTLDVAEGLPEYLIGDPGRLQQVLLNLVNNAVKFTREGSVQVRLRYDRAANRLGCAVIDTGVGIPADKQVLLFKRFSQVDSTISRVYGGSGLGLAISRSLVELMGGDIHLTSEEGSGSTFSFEIPAPIATASASPRPQADDITKWEAGDAPLLLIVDDRDENRDILKLMTTAVGLRSVLAASGEEALVLARKQHFDLILMDVRMPELSGLEASRQIRSESGFNARTPILAISANVSAAEIDECLEAGMQGHIAKPIRAEDLLHKISAWVGSKIPEGALNMAGQEHTN